MRVGANYNHSPVVHNPMSLSVLISGAGVAGPTLAYWLNRCGFRTTIVESAPALRSGGYVIDFWGLGYDVAEKMGLLSDIERFGYRMRELRIVNDRGERIAGFGTRVFQELTGGRYITLARSDLSRLIFDKIKDDSEVFFGKEVISLTEDTGGVNVTFSDGGERRFDLIIGADGLHSRVRRLVFGPQERFERALGYTAAAFEVQGYRPRAEGVYVMHNEPGRMLARIALGGDRTLFLLVFTGDDPIDADQSQKAAQKAVIKQRFQHGGWETGTVLSQIDRASDLYFDRISQIEMPSWSLGRTALIGDAAFCVSLLAGQGSALAITSAYVLAGELGKTQKDFRQAYRNYENFLRPFITRKQAAARGFAGSFAPKTTTGRFVRNAFIQAFKIPGVAKLIAGREFADRIVLPSFTCN
jgi:2-polyprenyl-6-methoxyphenol hydroxylase-like FAD-dependent oxidoreductase